MSNARLAFYPRLDLNASRTSSAETLGLRESLIEASEEEAVSDCSAVFSEKKIEESF